MNRLLTAFLTLLVLTAVSCADTKATLEPTNEETQSIVEQEQKNAEVSPGYCHYGTENKDISILHVNGTEIPSIDEIVKNRLSKYNFLRSIDDDLPGYISDTTVYYKEGCEIYATSVAGLVSADDDSPIDTEPFPDNPPFEISSDADIIVYLGTESGGTLGNIAWYFDNVEIEEVCCSKFSPIWSPDGERILFLEENEIKTSNGRDDSYSTTSLSKVLMMDADGSNISDCLYVCEPDGTQDNDNDLRNWGNSLSFSNGGDYLQLTTYRPVLNQVENTRYIVEWDSTPENETSTALSPIYDAGVLTGNGLQQLINGGVNCPTIHSLCGPHILMLNNKMNFGEDPSLDLIYSYCQKDDDFACTILSSYSVAGSEYKSFAQSCGGRGCEISSGSKYLDGYEIYGDSTYLDDLYDVCATADAYACYELYTTAPSGSEYEVFGESCGRENDENKILIKNCDIFDKPIETGRFILGYRVLPTIANDSPALVSTDGNYFAGRTSEYVEGEPDKNLLFVMSLDGSEIYQPERPVTAIYERPIAFSADGQQLIFSRSVPNPNGEFGTGIFAEYEGSRAFYAFRYDKEDLIMNIDGSKQRPLTEAEKLQYQDGISPDGKKVVFTDLVNGRDEIFVMDADGTNRKQLTFSE